MTATRRVLPAGERALLAEVDGLDEVLALHAALAASVPAGVGELVPAARTVLVRFDPARIAAAAVREWIAGADEVAVPSAAASETVLEVVYDGADLAETARLLGIAPADLAARHARTPWRVAFTGFAPGFGYLVGEGWPFDVPRLDSPRTRVPAGAVGLAGAFTGAYPRETPGGWRLIGTTSATLFDPDAAEPALLAPGTRVRFSPLRARAAASARPAASASPADAAVGTPDGATFLRWRQELQAPSQETGATVGVRGMADAVGAALRVGGGTALRVEHVGAATVQDLGRPGLAHLGVARSGALDRAALRLANRLVGNAEDAAGIEIAPGGFAATALRDAWIAVTGTWPPLAIDGRPVDAYRAQRLRRGQRVEIGWPAHGVRAYLALRGGVDAPRVLGSRATDTLAGLGPAPLRAGDEIATADAAAGPIPPLEVAPWGWPPAEPVLRLRPGPRGDWFTARARRALAEACWTVTTDADRVGVRLDGPALERARPGELPSEGMVPGALQVPPAGRPVVLLADGPVTGGYPVIAVVDDASLDVLAQAAPGTRIRFRGPT